MPQLNPNFEFIIQQDGRDKFSLDVEKITDFPLALTYSIKDVQDPSSSKGSFSKTFSIPATAKNNKILRSLYSNSLYDSFQYIEDYDALVFVDGMKVLQGKFQIKGTKYRGKPKSYECNVYGENYQWVNALSELNLCEVDFTAGNFFPDAPTTIAYNKAAIENTWQFNEAGETIGGAQSHIVFPLVNTGKWNYTDANGNAIATPSDMSPAFFLYDIIKCIFAKQGYTIESTFFETTWFKKLVSYLPRQRFVNNPNTIEQNSFEVSNASNTDWKIPLNYHQTAGQPNCGSIGNTFHGASQGLTPTCPNCDPSTLITTQNITPNFDIVTPLLNIPAMSDLEEYAWAGYMWHTFAFTNSQNRCGWFIPSSCQNGAYTYLGTDWDCAPCNAFVTPDTKVIPMNNTNVFQTSYLGKYKFGGSVGLEMENAYAVNDPVYQYDPSNYNSIYQKGTFKGGLDFPEQQVLSNAPDYEERRRGVTYSFYTYLIHYKESTGKYHIVASASERKLNPNPTDWLAWYNDNSPYALGDPNLTAQLTIPETEIDILNANDKVFIYSEVVAESNLREETNYYMSKSVEAICQMKYRYTNQEFYGNLSPEIIEGGSVSLSQILPCDILQLDWVNGLTGLFNLFWASDEETKTIIVEPRDIFFKPIDQSIDWTDKLDHGTDQQNEYIYDALKRNLCFTYENDSGDGFVEERNRRKGQQCELGSHSMNLGELFVNEEQRIGSEFYAPTYMFYDRTISNNYGYKRPFIPVIHSEYTAIWAASTNADLPDKMDDYMPRLLIWYGMQPMNQADGITNNNTWRWGYDANNNNGVYTPHSNLNTYPFAGVYSDQDGNLAGGLSIGGQQYNNPSLYFENSDVNAVTTPPPYEQTNGLYEMFWEFNILTLVDRPKILKANFKLTAADIANLDFQKLIHIQGAQSTTYWILNKIVDYKCGKNTLTQVELFEYHNARPLKGKFPIHGTGWGNVFTNQSHDFIEHLVEDNKVKVPTNVLINGLLPFQPNKGNKIPIGTNTSPLPQLYDQKNSAVGKFTTYTQDGTSVPKSSATQQNANLGSNKSANVGAITIGNDIDAQKSKQLTIGQGANPRSDALININANGNTALSITNDGIIREGGGGCCYYQDANGDIREVMTGVPIVNITGRTQQYEYTKCVLFDDKVTR